MSDFPGSRLFIQSEQVVTRRPTSESLFQPMAGSINSILARNYFATVFSANGSYRGALGRNRFDGFFRFKFNAQIIAVSILNGDPGTSGTTEVDILRFTASGGIGSSIFSTTPKITSAAPANSWVATGESGTGLVAPVLVGAPANFNVNAGDVLQAKLLQAMGGNPKDLQVEVYWLPRD